MSFRLNGVNSNVIPLSYIRNNGLAKRIVNPNSKYSLSVDYFRTRLLHCVHFE